MPGFFLRDDGAFGRLHPATRLMVLGLACWPPLALADSRGMAAILALYLAAAMILRAGRNVWRARWWIAAFMSVTLVLWTLFQPGQGSVVARLGPLSLRADALDFGAAMGMRLVCFFTAALVFLAATRIEDMQQGFRTLGIPYRVAFAFGLAFRLAPLFLESAGHVAAAQRTRGLDLNAGGRLARLRRYTGIVAPVLLAAIRRADGMALALDSKGFGASPRRTSVIVYRVGWRDATWLAAMIALGWTVSLRERLIAFWISWSF